MKLRRALLLATIGSLWAALGTEPTAAQMSPALPVRYLLATDVFDARAVWVNPAGLARRIEASIGADATVWRDGGRASLQQFGVTLASRNLAFGWIRDRFRGGGGNDTYALGLGLGDETFSAGTVRRWYRGALPAAAWDVGARLAASPALHFALVWRNIGVRADGDTLYPSSIVPGAGLSAWRGRFQVGAEWEVADDLSSTRAYHVGGRLVVWRRLGVAARAGLLPGSSQAAVTVAVTWEDLRFRAAGVASMPPGDRGLEAIGAAAMLVATPPRSGRR